MGLKRCLRCGAENDDAAAVCPKCGGSVFIGFEAGRLSPYSEHTASRLTPKGRTIYENAYAGDPAAMCEYGQMLRVGGEGLGMWGEDAEEAYDWFLCAATCGCADGFYRAGCMHWYHELLWREDEGNLKEAVYLFQAGAKMGSARCMCMLGEAYLKGQGVKQDGARAAEYLEDAIAAGDKDAMILAAPRYLHGSEGFEHDPEKAASLYRRAGAEERMYVEFRNAYETGDGLPKDEAKAAEMGEAYLKELMRLYETVPEKDQPCCYAWQIGEEYNVRGDIETAVLWYRKAMESGDPIGRLSLQHLKRL